MWQHDDDGRETLIGAQTYTYEMMPTLQCVLGTDQYDCMQKIFQDEADLIELGTGLSYTAGEYYNMIPLVAEKYVAGQLYAVSSRHSLFFCVTELEFLQWRTQQF